MPYYRSMGIESVTGTVETLFGALDFRGGDYVYLPRGTSHRWLPFAAPVRGFVMEASSHITPPGK